MVEETDNLVLEHLRHLRRGQDEMRAELGDLKTRAAAIEEIQGQILVLLSAINKRVDRIEERLARVERRLELTEA